jgi:hypothetical protein
VVYREFPFCLVGGRFDFVRAVVCQRVFENRVLRRIFGPKSDEITGGWRKLHNEKLHNMYSSPSKIKMFMLKRKRWAGQVTRMRAK